MIKLDRTITTIFFVPTLKIGRERLNGNGYINGYIKDARREVQYENCVYVLFKPKDMDRFKMFLDEEYDRTKQVIDDYDYEEGYVVVVYELDEKWEKDFAIIRQGKYSKVSNEFKDIFQKTVKIVKNGLRRDEVSLQHRIFRKSNDLKEYWEEHLGIEFTDDMEVWQGWIEEKEIMNIDEIIKENV